MAAVTLICGDELWPMGRPPAPAWAVARRPDKTELEPVFADPNFADCTRIIVCGDDADLAAVALRLLRMERLDIELAFVPSATPFTSVVCRLYDLPLSPEKAAYLARVGTARPVPLVRDDSGGVLLGMGVLSPVDGTVYCDETLVLRGQVEAIEVMPDPEHGLLVQVVRGRDIRKGRWTRGVKIARGRALQLGLEPTTVLRDGAPGTTPDRWTWYRHTEDLLLVAPRDGEDPKASLRSMSLRDQIRAQQAGNDA